MATINLQGGINFDTLHVGEFFGMNIDEATSARLVLSLGAQRVVFTGQGFTYDANQQIVGGTITGLSWTLSGGRSVEFTGISVPVPQANQWFYSDNTQAALSFALSGADQGNGSSGDDLLRGYAGNDTLTGGMGADQVWGGAGDDVIYGLFNPEGPAPAVVDTGNYLRGEDGNDTIFGGAGFDDIHGNIGDDLEYGAAGDDWVVGGQGHDRLYGDAGNDIVYGNLGNDTCVGGDGADLVRGGQAEDRLEGGAGNDWLSGDRGSDTLVGGAGADIFHSFGDAGLDIATDFNAAEGDRVQLDPGTQYAASQQGADVWIDMTGGGRLVLQNVQLASLPAGWIFVG
ncbi:calcium-binding protein [Phenylobacterium sp.]|jgi:Ca2+-binding RTX toxin-like protein|uniref:calcium-binding protein n=1 Tax=Phenylobacterium sp. TaxID=1871053 RepID=UPI002F93B687